MQKTAAGRNGAPPRHMTRRRARAPVVCTCVDNPRLHRIRSSAYPSSWAILFRIFSSHFRTASGPTPAARGWAAGSGFGISFPSATASSGTCSSFRAGGVARSDANDVPLGGDLPAGRGSRSGGRFECAMSWGVTLRRPMTGRPSITYDWRLTRQVSRSVLLYRPRGTHADLRVPRRPDRGRSCSDDESPPAISSRVWTGGIPPRPHGPRPGGPPPRRD